MDFMEWYMVVTCLGVGILCLAWARDAAYLAAASPSFPRVTATVTAIEDRRGQRRRSELRPSISISFTYRYQGQHFEAEVAPPGTAVEPVADDRAETILERYQKGAAITALVNPRKPKQAFLEPVAGWRVYALIASASVFLAAGVFILVERHPVVRSWAEAQWPGLIG